MFSPAKVSAAVNCSPTVSVETNNNYNTKVDFSSDIWVNHNFRLSGDKFSTQIEKQTNNHVIFNLGKLTPGLYKFILDVDTSSDNSGSYASPCHGPGTQFTVPNEGQGGSSTTQGSITFGPQNPRPTDTIAVRISNLPKDGIYFMSVGQPGLSSSYSYQCSYSSGLNIVYQIGPLKEGQWRVIVGENKDQTTTDKCQLSDKGPIATGEITVTILGQYNDYTSPPVLPPVCDLQKNVCHTAFGDISTNPEAFVGKVFAILLSLSGGIALILIIISGYRLMTSQGNPEKVQAAREQLTSAIIGLLFIIFSLAILQIIGVDILRIPGLK